VLRRFKWPTSPWACAAAALAASRIIAWGFALAGGHGALSAPFEQWDSFHYLAIAQHGYPGHDNEQWAFSPLYPLLARTVFIGVMISIVAYWIGLAIMHVLTEEVLDRPAATRAVWIAAFFPASFFFTAYYTEGLFLALSAGAILAVRRGHPKTAALLGLLATLTRNVGIALVIPLFMLGARGARSWRERIATAAGPVVASLGFLAFAYVSTGDWNAPSQAEKNWGRAFRFPFSALENGAIDTFETLTGSVNPTWSYEPGWMRAYQFALVLLAFGAVVWLCRRLSAAYGLYVLAAMAVPLSDYWPEHSLVSVPRYLSALFPIYMWAGARTRRRELPPVLLLEAVGLAIFSWRFGAGMWAG
jgi:hypothetical protein